MEHDSPDIQQDKMGLFWSIYCLDKALSLRLGRSSSIQDYDISLPMTFEASAVAEPWKTIHKLWIRLARIQGKVYELLYSPAALAQPEEDRVSYARQLAEEMQLTVMGPFKVSPPLPSLPTPKSSGCKAKLTKSEIHHRARIHLQHPPRLLRQIRPRQPLLRANPHPPRNPTFRRLHERIHARLHRDRARSPTSTPGLHDDNQRK